MQLDLNLLTALDALLEEESVTGAADRLHLSAPAMSRTLGRIRQATGDQILVRAGRVMQPTPRALALRDEVRALVLRSAAVLAPEQELHLDALQRTFTVRAHDALATALAPVLVQRVAAIAPGVRLRFLGEASGETTDLGRGVVDLEIGSAVPSSPAIDHDAVGVDELVGVARADHPMLTAPIGLEEFVAVPHVLVSRRGRLRDRVDDLLDAAGVSRTVVAAVAATGAAIAIVRATDAVAVVPASVAARLDAGVARFRLPVDLPPVPIVLAWHRQFTADVGHHWFRTLTRDILCTSEQVRDYFDRHNMGVILIGMPGIEKRLARYPQLYSRIGFAHEYRPLTPDELTAVLTSRLPAGDTAADGGIGHATAIATIVRITSGNFRLVDRLVTQIERIQALNNLDALTPEVVDAAREALLIGH